MFLAFFWMVVLLDNFSFAFLPSFPSSRVRGAGGAPNKFDTTTVSSAADAKTTSPSKREKKSMSSISSSSDAVSKKFLVHWKGEKDAGYSKPFRQLEFQAAVEAEIGTSHPLGIQFDNALTYSGDEFMPDVNVEHFNEAMQFVSLPQTNMDRAVPEISRNAVIKAASRCSLIHALYEVVVTSDTLEDLAQLAIQDGGFDDLYEGAENEACTWCFRARDYSPAALVKSNEGESTLGRAKRYGASARSMKLETKGLNALKDLLIQFGGKVDLKNPQVKVYIFDGLQESSNARKILARRIADGPKTSIIAPATRICITNTPLEPIAAFCLCNVARIRNGDAVLDPYCGSGATLLAAAIMAPTCQTVGVEIAHNGLVNRDHVIQDFTSRSLMPPKQLIYGDSTDPSVRKLARENIGGRPFDGIVTDPPYGIRESSNYSDKSPLEDLFGSIISDRDADSRLLRVGGRLVAFVPVTDEQSLRQMLPSDELTEQAGLQFEIAKEQPLNEKLSRWLVSYVCKR